MAIDMVLAIKKENNKKHRLSISSAFRKGISNNIYCNLEYHIQLCLFCVLCRISEGVLSFEDSNKSRNYFGRQLK